MNRTLGKYGLLLCILGVTLLFGMNLLFREPAELALPKESAVPGEALVQFKPHVSEGQVTGLLARVGATMKEKIDLDQIYLISFPATITHDEILRELRQLAEVSYAEPNGLYETAFTDLIFPAQAWAVPPKRPLGAGAKVTVAVIDTAFDLKHPALAAKCQPGFNFTNNTPHVQSKGAGQDWHGTAVAGRVLEGAGHANVAIMPLQVFGSSGGASWSTIIKAINYAVDKGAQVINLSLGGYTYSPLVQKAIDRAVSRGVVVVASAGNNNTTRPAYPASMKGVLCVAAVDGKGQKAPFSNYGTRVDLSAPGSKVRVLNHGGGTRAASGTSFSAPFIAGMAAMLKSAFPHLTPSQITQTLKAKANGFYRGFLYKGYRKCKQWFSKWDPRSKRYIRGIVYRCLPICRYHDRYYGQMGTGYYTLRDVQLWTNLIRSGKFRFPWEKFHPVPKKKPLPPRVSPKPQPPQGTPKPPAAAGQPWLVKGKGGQHDHLLTPAGDVVPVEKEPWEEEEEKKREKKL